jgi:hypothetical protein
MLVTAVASLLNGQSATDPAEALKAFQVRSRQMSAVQMGILAGWAGGNFAASGVGIFTSEGQERYFHLGNVVWNTVNISLAMPALLVKPKNDFSADYAQVLRSQKRTELIYLLNGGLDFLYAGTGFWLMKNAETAQWQPELQKGIGRSLVMQGLFLLGFDFTNYLIHAVHDRRRLKPLQAHFRCSVSASSAGLRWNF